VVVVRLESDSDLAAVLGAACGVSEDIYSLIEKDGRGLRVSLWPRGRPRRGLAALFRKAYAEQKALWLRARQEADLRRRILREAEREQPQRPEASRLSPASAARIRVLVEEAEREGQPDPLGILRPWKS